MDYLLQQLAAAEAKYYGTFYGLCKQLFSTCHMPSHDHTHHVRVWEYCKRLLIHASKQSRVFNDDFIEALLAAALLHDIGLSRITDERHGSESAELFKEYIASNPDIHLRLYDDIVEAIRVHDLKSPSSLNQTFDLASILTVCDNLDSFGYIGAYRYAEIYLIRGIDTNEIAFRSLNNIEKRFKSFELHYVQLPQFYAEQKQRYLRSCSVFEDERLMAELTEAILQLSIKEQKGIFEVVEIYGKKSDLPFWIQLKKELE
ncbi:MAG: HD domain-containing protein [Prevotellaceae bacterium]|nr:HD domain-containing protein [Prevotellaceae bacterium]